MKNYYKPGDWNATCDRCGFKFKASELIEDWQGLRVCREDFETRHPMDFLKVYPDKVYVPWTRPDYTPGVSVSSSSTGGTALATSALASKRLGL
jgi:hypothetical protein